MKTKKTTPPSSSDNPQKLTITVNLPTAWTGLTSHQLRYLCTLLASGHFTTDEVKAYFLIRLTGVAGLIHPERLVLTLGTLIAHLDFIDQPPIAPVRYDRVGQTTPVHPLLSGTPFRSYLEVENYYQGFLQSRNPEALDALGAILYPGHTATFTPDERYMLLLWLVGMKQQYTDLFPDLFRQSATTDPDDLPDPRDIMNAEIRALTAGDITKTEAVLSADTLTALTELNDKAREARELERKTKV